MTKNAYSEQNSTSQEAFDTASVSRTLALTRVPTAMLGKVFDHGKESAYAAHLLAIKCSKGPGFTLNERHCAREYGISRKSFQAGIRIMRNAGVLMRQQPSHRDFAVEKIAEHGSSYVLVSSELLKSPSKVVAFVLAVSLSPEPIRPGDAAKRIGLTSRATIHGLADKAISHGCASNSASPPTPILLARRGFNFGLYENRPAKNEPAKKRPTHRVCKKDTEICKKDTEKGNLMYGTRSCERDDTKAISWPFKGKEADWIVLKDWKTSSYWRDRGFASDGETKTGFSHEDWKRCLDYYGGAPSHLYTPNAHAQALEIVQELVEISGECPILFTAMQAFAFWVCRAVAAGKSVKSFAFIAEELARRCDDGDTSWLFDIPTRLDQSEFESAYALAQSAVKILEDGKARIHLRELLSTQRVERLAIMLRKHTHNSIISGITWCISHRMLPEDRSWLCGWTWFENSIMEALGEQAYAA